MSDADLQVSASGVLTAMTSNNAIFPNPTPDLATLNAAIEGFAAALVLSRDGSRQDVENKRQKRDALIDILLRLADYVLFTSAGDKAKALSSGFKINRLHTPRPDLQKPGNLRVTEGLNPGELQISFDRVEGARSYQYQYTTDPVTEASTWQSATGTVRKFLVTGLQSGKRYWCRIVAVGIRGQIACSDAVSKIVQ